MKYVCDASGGKTWFRIETEAEATAESDIMRHKVAKYFYQEKDKATRSFVPSSRVPFEREIGLAAHIQTEMPLFLTLRDGEGNNLVTAMLPPGGQERDGCARRSARMRHRRQRWNSNASSLQRRSKGFQRGEADS